MKIRTEWLSYLHNLRKSEVQIIFAKCPERLFETGLELGAGDGFQSRLLAKYVSSLTCTDYGAHILMNESNKSITYRTCDAEHVEREFSSQQFDLVFSSNLLEHIPSPQKTLSGICEVLKDEGITIHVIPSPFWKFCQLLLYFPNLGLCVLEAITERDGLSKLLAKMRRFSNAGSSVNDQKLGNNPKTDRFPRSFLGHLFVPEPHGVSSRNMEEFYAFSKSRWKREFREANLELLSIMKGPVTSGYGFGLNRLRSTFMRLGVSSEYIYVAKKKGKDCAYKHFFKSGFFPT